MTRLKRALRNAKLLGELIVRVVTGGASGCAGQVVDPASTCPDHAIPTTTCDVPLPANCVFSPNIHLMDDGSCVVDVFTGCQYNGNFVHFALPYDGGAVSTPGQFYGSTCTFTVEPQ